MRGGQDGELAVALGFFAHAGVEGEAADDQHVEADALDRFLGGLLDQLRADRAVLGADADGGATLSRCRPPRCNVPSPWIHSPA